jgi:hypothetical protein
MNGVVSSSARLDYDIDSICSFIVGGGIKDFYLKNVGNDILRINSTSFTGLYPSLFSLLASPVSINTGDSGKFTISMEWPLKSKFINGNDNTDEFEDAVLNIATNDPSKSTFRVSLQTPTAAPVELIAFSGTVIKRDVQLNWTTATETNNKGFEIQRAEVINGLPEYSKIGYVNGKGNSNTQTKYSFNDFKLKIGKYIYRLKQMDLNGNYKFYDLSGEIEISLPKKFSLSQNYPNPFNPATKIDFDIPYDCNVSIKIYDISGREIKNLLNEKKTAGYYTLDFNAGNISSGVCFYRIVADNFKEVKKMLVIK